MLIVEFLLLSAALRKGGQSEGLRFNSARGIFPLSHFYDMMMKRLSHLSR